MKCPLKFARYEFEGGTECVGAECGFYGAVCRNDALPPDSDVSAASVDANGGNAAPDSREKLRIVMPRHNGEKYAKLMVKQFDQLINDELHDSREKLEADVLKFSQVYYTSHLLVYDKVIELLDRQKAITERECLAQSVQGADAILTAENAELQAKVDELTAERDHLTNAINELQKKQPYCHNPEQPLDTLNTIGRYIDELTAELEARDKYPGGFVPHSEMMERVGELTEQLEAAHAKNRALKLHISKMQSGRHGWHVKGVELQRQVDELTAQLHASNAERARLRECLGIATDNAHDFLTLVDESGNVYDRDEGLA